MDLTTIRKRLLKVLSQFIDLSTDHDDQFDSLNVISDETLDSFSVMSVIAILEDEFKIKFTPEELSSERMRTFGGMMEVIFKKHEKK